MNSRFQSRGRTAALALLLAASLIGAVAAIGQTRPAGGRLLVATRHQQGFFARTVVLLLDYSDHGALGLILNRPTQVPLDQALQDITALQGRGHLLYVGGPVSLEQVTVLIHARTPPPRSFHIVDHIYASGSIEVLHNVMAHRHDNPDFRAYAGYAGWAPGQLDAEIAKGDWIIVAAAKGDIFTDDPVHLWRALINHQARQVVTLEHRQPTRL